MTDGLQTRRRLPVAAEAVLSVVGLAALPIATLAISALLGWASLQVTGQLLEWDTNLYSLINGWNRPEVTSVIFLLLNDPGIDYVAVIVPTLLYVWFRRRRQIPWAIIAVLLALLMGSMTIPFTHQYGLRERPFVSITTAIIDPEWRKVWMLFPTFPSGHLRETVGLSIVLAYFWPAARWPVAAYAALVAITRLYLGAHYPTDVAAGGLIGAMSGLVAVFTANRLGWFVTLAGGIRWIRSAYCYVFTARSPGCWSQDPLPAKVIRLIVLLGAVAGGAFAGGWAINFRGSNIIYDLMRNFDNSLTQPLLIRFDPQSAELLYQVFGNGQIVFPVLGGLVLLAAMRRGWREVGRGVVVLSITVLLVFLVLRLLGSTFDRPLPYSQLQADLPQEWRLPWAGLVAFPQRQMIMVAALVAVLAYFARPALPAAYAYMLAVAGGLLYFGVAWPTDIIISMLVGQGAARYSIFLSRNLTQEVPNPQGEPQTATQETLQTSPSEGSELASS